MPIFLPPTMLTDASAFVSWNPSDKNASVTLSNANATESCASAGTAVRSLLGKSTGKWVAGITIDSGANLAMVGIANASASLSTYPGGDANAWAFMCTNGNKWSGGSNSAYGATVANLDQVDVIWDATGGKLYFAKNGTVMNSGDPVAGTGFAYSGLSGTMMVIAGNSNSAGTSQCTFVAPIWTGTGFSRWAG